MVPKRLPGFLNWIYHGRSSLGTGIRWNNCKGSTQTPTEKTSRRAKRRFDEPERSWILVITCNYNIAMQRWHMFSFLQWQHILRVAKAFLWHAFLDWGHSGFLRRWHATLLGWIYYCIRAQMKITSKMKFILWHRRLPVKKIAMRQSILTAWRLPAKWEPSKPPGSPFVWIKSAQRRSWHHLTSWWTSWGFQNIRRTSEKVTDELIEEADVWFRSLL